MKDYLKDLTAAEKEALILAPVYSALMGALHDGKISSGEEKDAIDLAHFRTSTSAPILHAYYQEVEKSFKQNMKLLKESLPADIEESKTKIRTELLKIESISKKLDSDFAKELSDSLQSFTKHVAREKEVAQGWIRYFVFPANFEKELGDIKGKH